MIRLHNYMPTLRELTSFKPSGDWIVIKEELKKDTPSFGILLLDNKNTTIGTILKLSAQAKKDSGLLEGDKVLYTEWHGGKWSFTDPSSPNNEIRVIIMELNDILATIRKE